MANQREWAAAYLAQARADLDAAKALRGAAPSVFAMLMQMVFEKLAKAALLRSSQMTISGAHASHAAASQLIGVLRRNRSLLRRLGSGREYAWKDVLPVVAELERLHPSIAGSHGGAQLEYPWEEGAAVKWPARHLPLAQRLRDPASPLGARLLTFGVRLAADLDELFPA